jgi:outer membrane receptor protein involved in Fe transport
LATTIFSGALMAMTAPAAAQDAAPPQDEESTEVEEVVVTGSRIRRDPTNAPTPLIQVSREDLTSTGLSTVIDYLATIPALSNSLVPSDTVGTGSVGLAFANLRSLGTGRTLTLVDGRRHVSSLGGSLAVDVDTIPRLLIENVEIITGGASSVYGADAVSGVVNFQLRRDFDGLEVDAHYGQINQDGQANRRISALAGVNLFDDRLNLWGFAEHEDLDELTNDDIDWLRANYGLVGADVDPAVGLGLGPQSDGIVDARVYSGLRSLQRVRWSVVNLANNQPGSPLSDPDIPYFNCTGTAATATNGNCTLPNPGYSFVFEGNTARPTDFGTRVGTGLSRLLNVGGDGEDTSEFSQFTFFPEGSATRLAAGANWSITDDITLRLEAKNVQEENYAMGQASFFDVYINNNRPTNQVSQIVSGSQYHIRLSDNAFLPSNVRTAIENNRLIVYTAPTAGSPSVPTGATVAAPFARAALRGQDRFLNNTRELSRFVGSLEGSIDRVAFVDNVNWDLSYTYGEVEIESFSTAIDTERQAYASDAVFDVAGIVNNRPGEIVCRVQLLRAQNVATITDQVRGGDLRSNALGQAAINECRPLNIFGKGNQSAEALAYIGHTGDLEEHVEQEQALASISGELWDFWGAGPIGAAIGVEYRREFTEGLGYEEDNAGRLTQGFVVGSTPASQYETEEAFAELSLPLFRDSWLGEYAELSGSYRYFDYTTVGTGDVYGVNLIYRPIRDVMFKSSFNTAFRAPNLTENFATFTPSFANFAFTDPCSTTNINAPLNAQYRTNRIANCTALAAARNLTFDFAGATASIADDFDPTPLGSGSVRGVSGGNPFLTPEESDSFTFSTVFQPRMFPDFTLVLDYYEIELTNVIAAITPIVAAQNCVDGPSLNQAACATIFRNNPNLPFAIGAPTGDPIGAFIQGSINYAKRTTRGLDFTANYRLDLQEAFGLDAGRLSYRLAGSWLIEQKNFNNAQNPADFTGLDSAIFYPRVRLTSALTYTPVDRLSVTWTMDWQASQDNAAGFRTYAETGNPDARLPSDIGTGNFARHDFTVRYTVNDEVSVRAGVVNAFDAEQARYLGTTLTSNFDPYGTRFFIGLNFRPF